MKGSHYLDAWEFFLISFPHWSVGVHCLVEIQRIESVRRDDLSPKELIRDMY